MMNKKEEILKATGTLFSQKGYHLSVSDIATQVSIKPPSIYSHFKSKDEIIEQVILNEIENFYGTILNQYLDIISTSTCKEQLEHIFNDVLAYFSDIDRLRFWRNIPSIENDWLKEKCKTIIREHEVRFNKNIEELFSRAIEQHEMKQSVHEGHKLLFLAMVQGLLSRLYMYKNLINGNECAKKTWNAYWESIKADE